MPKYQVRVPAVIRIEEIHEIEADSEEEAKQFALTGEPDEKVEDPDFYEIDKSNITVTLHVDHEEGLKQDFILEMEDRTADNEELQEMLDELVANVFSHQASWVNNDGPAVQVRFLFDDGWTIEELRKRLGV